MAAALAGRILRQRQQVPCFLGEHLPYCAVRLAPGPLCLSRCGRRRGSQPIALALERQFDLSPLLGVVGAPLIERIECRLDPEWLQPFDHLGTDGTINTHPAERSAAIAAVIEMTAATVIAPGVAVGTAVGNV
ncbi:MAG TPA: hypothetical protein VGC09_16135 [Rhodopila sp.]